MDACMWLNWEKQESNLNFRESSSIHTPRKFSLAGGLHTPKFQIRQTSVQIEYQTRELVNENKRLWVELKEKNELIIGLRDEIYVQHCQLKQMETYRKETEQFTSTDQGVDLIREINNLKVQLREKQILIHFLNDMVENLCDEVLQNEIIDNLETETESLETENIKLTKKNSDIRVRLKILQHDNDKLLSKYDHAEEESKGVKKKLEKTTMKLKEKEKLMLSFRKFTDELTSNLQRRISRSKSENHVLKGMIEQMKHIAENYKNLECENLELMENVYELETNADLLKDRMTQLQTKPSKLEKENSSLCTRLSEYEQEIDAMVQKNKKLKSNLKVYEQILIKNKAYIEQLEARLLMVHRMEKENNQFKEKSQHLNETLNKEAAKKYRISSKSLCLKMENDQLSKKVAALEVDNRKLTSHFAAVKHIYEESQTETQHLRKQLLVYKNTVENQETTLKIRVDKIHNLMKDNEGLKKQLQQYENQIQAAGRLLCQQQVEGEK